MNMGWCNLYKEITDQDTAADCGWVVEGGKDYMCCSDCPFFHMDIPLQDTKQKGGKS
jgi:hypothetical protein